ncbi:MULTISPECIES: helix-turn-helix domain-containing protein [unclassified Oceanispirochaeta]|uniref:helix-turn-helix domain-containing protein n=1 Tax=unclassified Oceanispirochaeta TaxID=2635722 RepID=UPI000E08F8B5|nr:MULTISPECIES: helix-turn-helix transcriptional regulator [unclassified Oceanispirochaeta]MBF9015719.1 helix-turn-helix transcriptional regulator [Oceanispirochaeta sp. M2]NPD72184.1 helix-turn-helix transcriptional regulator [Oceanispirochaeta sp. M1]RDG32283.1 XRE family transcriptional regulator [Oceanispirochaeta sp. M1]
MQAVVKKPHIEINADTIPEELIRFLNDTYGYVDIIDDDELIDIRATDWYQARLKRSTPGSSLRRYRKRNGMSQSELAAQIGTVKQNVSAMERGSRGISKVMVLKLSEIFQVSPARFI